MWNFGQIPGRIYCIFIVRRIWRERKAFIPVRNLCLSGIFHLVSPEAYPTPIFMLFAGGLFFGALFMATDMVTSPVTNLGSLIFGVLIGSLVIVIRFWGGLPEGVQYSILFANGCVPIIDRLIKTRPYGVTKGSKAA